MKIRLTKSTILAGTLCLASLGSAEPLKTNPKATVESEEDTAQEVDWQSDPNCQFVFFAVLEGLYRDGVQDEIIEAIIGKSTADIPGGIKRTFVLRCKLCHATYEAFRTYQSRPSFELAKNKNTFGKGIDAKILDELNSKDAETRVYAMGSIIRPWIKQRVELTQKTEAEKKAMAKVFREYLEESKDLTHQLSDKDPAYIDWSFYGSCQACEVAKDLGGK